ncbi:MAG TPA: hypothetical protein VG223_07080 [Solirubrobacteraceae bacterium]|jgi:predicted lipoprotein with Yx(FWY)xxD motif|nr:hypothetical protein [Solirubrobacteraceae bacterium]
MTKLRLRSALTLLAVATVSVVPAIAAGHVVPAHSAAATVVQTDTLKGYGKVVAASNGHVLYLSDSDPKNRSRCSAACQKVWKPYLAPGGVTAKARSGLNAKLLGTIKLTGGRVQATYNGHPLYEYAKDRRAGQMNGQALYQFGGDWYLVGPKGKAITCQPGLICGY